MHIESGLIEGSRVDDKWRPLYDYGAVSVSSEVQFASAFADAPSVVVGLAKFDMEQGRHQIVAVHATNITPEGFTMVIESGLNTQLESVAAFWIAYGVAKPQQPRPVKLSVGRG